MWRPRCATVSASLRLTNGRFDVQLRTTKGTLPVRSPASFFMREGSRSRVPASPSQLELGLPLQAPPIPVAPSTPGPSRPPR